MRRFAYLLFCLADLGGLGVSFAHGQTLPSASLAQTPAASAGFPAPALTLAQVLDRAHRANPTLQAAQRHLEAVHAQEITAGLRQNPNLVVGTQAVTTGFEDPNGPPLYSAGLQRLFERGDKRGARLENARALTTLSRFQADDQRRGIDLLVRQAFARMLYAQGALAIAQANLASYRQTVELTRVQLQAGVVDQTDFDRIELQLAGFESDLDNAQLVLRQGSIALQTLLGAERPDPGFAIAGTLAPPPVLLTLDDLRAAALAGRPDLKAAAAQVEVNRTAVQIARSNGTADPTIEADYQHSGRASTLGGSLNLPLRIFDRNQGEKARAALELQSSQLELSAVRNQVLGDVDSAWAAYLSASSQAARYRGKYLAESARVRDNIQFSYRNGNSTLLDYLSALAEYRQVNLASLNADLQLLLALQQLSYVAAVPAYLEVLP